MYACPQTCDCLLACCCCRGECQNTAAWQRNCLCTRPPPICKSLRPLPDWPTAPPRPPIPHLQLERLATQSHVTFAPLAHQFSLPAGGPPLPPLLHQRSSSLFALVREQQQAAGGLGSPDASRGRQLSGTAPGTGLLGKLGKLARTGSRDRAGSGTPGSGTWGSEGSARTSATSLGDAQAALADLQQRQNSSFTAAAGGAAGGSSGGPGLRKGSGNRIAPEDAV